MIAQIHDATHEIRDVIKESKEAVDEFVKLLGDNNVQFEHDQEYVDSHEPGHKGKFTFPQDMDAGRKSEIYRLLQESHARGCSNYAIQEEVIKRAQDLVTAGQRDYNMNIQRTDPIGKALYDMARAPNIPRKFP